MKRTKKYVAAERLAGAKARSFVSQDELYEYLEQLGKNWDAEAGAWIDAPPPALEKLGAPGVVHIRLNGNSLDVETPMQDLLVSLQKRGAKIITEPSKFYVNERRGTGGRVYATIDIEHMESGK